MKRVLCPKCDNYITFDETKYTEGQSLVFICEHCKKQFSIRIGKSKLKATRKEEVLDEQANNEDFGSIVVVENVERIMMEEGLDARRATVKAMKQIGGAIVGITAVLVAVFVPMAFFSGASPLRNQCKSKQARRTHLHLAGQSEHHRNISIK